MQQQILLGISPASSGSSVTFDPSNTAAGGVLSNSNRTLSLTSGSAVCSLSTLGRTSGKYYVEFRCDNLDALAAIGLQPTGNLTTNIGQEANEYAYRSGGQSYFSTVFNGKTGPTWTSGDVIGLAVDFTSKKGWVSKNGVYILSGDPAAGTTEYFAYSHAGLMFPVAQVNFTSQITGRWAAAHQTYAPPSGFSAYA